MAQAILAGLSAQKFDAVAVPAFAAAGGQTSPVNFNLTTQTGTVDWRANNKGELFQPGGGAFLINAPSQPADNAETYAVTLRFDPAPAGYDSGYANFVTVSVAWPASAAAADQTRRSFMRVISRY
jgi:hypothetical protein